MMINYKKIYLSSQNNKQINKIYNELLANKWQFVILDINGTKKVLTKEKAFFEIADENNFLDLVSKDCYYKSYLICKNEQIDKQDLNLFYIYINKYKNILEKNTYGGKYIFGNIAVRTTTGFITTIRGKENLDDYTLVYNVNHNTHSVEVLSKKATLNAPLLHYLFQINKNLKTIVHINSEFDSSLPYYDYAFPGTVRDSIRDIHTSFNIKYHGLFYLFDNNENLI